MSESNPNTYRFVVFSANSDKALIELRSTTPFGAVNRGDSINVQDLRGEDRESICSTSGHYSNVMSIEHRITQGPFGDIEHTTKITVDNTADNFK